MGYNQTLGGRRPHKEHPIVSLPREQEISSLIFALIANSFTLGKHIYVPHSREKLDDPVHSGQVLGSPE